MVISSAKQRICAAGTTEKKGSAGSRSGHLTLYRFTGMGGILISTYESVLPTYSIKQMNDTTYTVTKFKRSDFPYLHLRNEEQKENDTKLDNNLSRARSMIKQYGLCNEWDYFATFTLDKDKYDRHDLQKFRADLMEFMRYQRKKYRKLTDKRLSFVLVPEQHK
ncbi:MAG: hypothetical protein AAGU75_13350, partial [Bacillota bacterium]